MEFLEISLVGTVESKAMVFACVLSLVTKIVLTRKELPSASPRTLRIPSLKVPRGVDLNTHKESLENLLLVVRQFDSLTTNPTRGVLPVDGSLLTPPSFMTSRVPARVPLSFTTNIL